VPSASVNFVTVPRKRVHPPQTLVFVRRTPASTNEANTENPRRGAKQKPRKHKPVPLTAVAEGARPSDSDVNALVSGKSGKFLCDLCFFFRGGTVVCCGGREPRPPTQRGTQRILPRTDRSRGSTWSGGRRGALLSILLRSSSPLRRVPSGVSAGVRYLTGQGGRDSWAWFTPARTPKIHPRNWADP